MIEIKNLSKRYGTLTAVNDISFSVSPGTVLGFLGPNGAGKSTTMKMITGFLAPTSGSVSVCGHDVQSAPLAAKAVMGYLPEGAPSYGEMTVRGFLHFIADIRGLQGDRRRARLDDVIGRLQAENVTLLTADQNLRFCSRIAERGYVLERGRIVFDGSIAEFWQRVEADQMSLMQ